MKGVSTLEQVRVARDSLLQNKYVFPDNVAINLIDIGGIQVEIVRAASVAADSKEILILVHGGMFMSGSARSMRHLAAWLSLNLSVAVATPSLRLAPEHKHPAAIDDLAAVFDFIEAHGVHGPNAPQRPRSIAMFAESSGAFIALNVLLRRQASGLSMPCALVMSSPWLDLTCRGGSFVVNEMWDPVLQQDRLLGIAKAYLGNANPCDPSVSPAFADASSFAGLPEMLIHVGDSEVLLDDAYALAEKAQTVGVGVEIVDFSGVLHAWHTFFPIMLKAQVALTAIVDWLRPRIKLQLGADGE